MNQNQRRRLQGQFDRLTAEMPPEVVATATIDFGVLTSRIPSRYRASAARLRDIAARIANDER